MSISNILNFWTVLMIFNLIALVGPVAAGVVTPQAANAVAIVNDAPINREEYDKAVLKIQKMLLKLGKPLTFQHVLSIQKEVLESLIRQEILYQESRKVGIEPDETGINKEIETMKEQFSDETAYLNELNRRHITEQILRLRLERNSMIGQYIKQFVAKVDLPDNAATTYYEQNLNLFKRHLQLRVRHILVKSDVRWDSTRKENARKKAEQILKDLKKGQDFASTARDQSDGPRRKNGGDLGYIMKGQLDKQLEDIVFRLEPGETSKVVETDYGFHLFKLQDRKPETILSYDSVKDQIVQFLQEKKGKEEADIYAQSLRGKTRVEVLLKDQIIPEDADVSQKGENISNVDKKIVNN